MQVKRLSLVMLVVAVLVGAVVRLWHLGNDGHPLLWDEAALGYNAYSIMKTGRDEYGAVLPLILKSFGDYKPGLYAYTAILPIELLGLSEMSVRLPSAIAGIVTIVLVYWLVQQLFEHGGRKIGLAAAFLVGINPWLIHFSRGAWEANFDLMLTVAGILFFLKGRRQSSYFVLSAVLFGLTFFTYQGAKLFTPLIGVGLMIFYGRELDVKRDKFAKGGVAIFILFCALELFLSRGTSGRLAVYNVFAYTRPAADVQTLAAREGTTVGAWPFLVLHGEWLASTRRVLEGDFNYFSGRFLFVEGDWTNARLGSPYVGEFYWLDFPFLVLGLIFLIRRRDVRAVGFLSWWIVVSPLLGALSRDVVSAVRSLNLAMPVVLVASLGVDGVVRFIGQRSVWLRFLLGSGLFICYLWGVAYYLDSYFVHSPVTSSDQKLFGYKETVGLLREINTGNLPVYFTQKGGQPYIYVLFYDKVDPSLYQSEAKLVENPSGDVGEVDRFENFDFRNLYWPADRGIRNAYFVGIEDELPVKDIDSRRAKIIQDVKRADGTVAFRIVKTN